MLSFARESFREVFRAFAPLVGVIIILQLAVVQAPLAIFVQFLLGSLLAALGMVLLFAGIDVGILPMGRYIGAELPRKGSLMLILGVAFALGFATTVAEPDVLVLAEQVGAVSERAIGGAALVYVMATGVGAFVALGLLRVVFGFSMVKLLALIFATMIGLSILAPDHFVPLAYDAGSVTTGILTTPVVLAMVLGFIAVLPKRSAVADGFGLLGLASAGPILVMLLIGTVLGA